MRAWWPIFILLAGLGLGFTSCRSESPGDKLTLAIDREEAKLKDFDEKDAAQFRAAFKEARAQIKQGRLEYAAASLIDVWSDLEGQLLYLKNPDIDAERYDRLYTEVGGKIAAAECILKASHAKTSQALRALIQTAWNQSGPTYRSGKLYGENTNLGNGVYYIGVALGYVDYAVTLDSLGLEPSGTETKVHSVRDFLDELDLKILRAYEKTPIDHQAKFISINVLIKQSREMDARGWYDGALYTYLQANRKFSRLTAGEGQLKIDAPVGESDVSLARLLVQQAEVDGDTVVIGNSVLPALKTFLASPPPAPLSPGKKPVRITLVRWPYT